MDGKDCRDIKEKINVEKEEEETRANRKEIKI